MPDINPRGKSFVLHAICAAVMINAFLAMKQLKFGEYVAPQVSSVASPTDAAPDGSMEDSASS